MLMSETAERDRWTSFMDLDTICRLSLPFFFFTASYWTECVFCDPVNHSVEMGGGRGGGFGECAVGFVSARLRSIAWDAGCKRSVR